MKLFTLFTVALTAVCLEPNFGFAEQIDSGMPEMTPSEAVDAAMDVPDQLNRALESLRGSPRGLQQCTAFTMSKSVVIDLNQNSQYYKVCSSYLSTISSATSTLNSRFGVVNTVVSVVKTVLNRLSSTIDSVYSAANAVLGKLTSIPKVGQVIKIGLKILQTVKTLLGRVASVINKVSTLFSNLAKAFKAVAYTMKGLVVSSNAAAAASSAAAKTTQASIDCTTNTDGCTDDQGVEQYNAKMSPTVKRIVAVGAACPKAFGTIASTLQAIVNALKESIFNAIRAAIEKLEKVLKPILDMIKKVVDELKKKFTEVYCCATPGIVQSTLKFVSQLLDVATCPIDGAVSGIDAAMELLEAEMNKLINSLLLKVMRPIGGFSVTYPDIDTGSVDPSKCSITSPSVVIKTVYPFQPWLDALKGDKPSTAVFKHAAMAFGNEIKSACSEAASELGRNLGKDCCINFKPLRDGQFCDPSNLIPYKKCSQCISGRNGFHSDKFHVACGKPPPVTKTITKIGSGIKKGVKSIGKGIKKVFG